MPVKYDQSGMGGGEDPFLAMFLGTFMEANDNAYNRASENRKWKAEFDFEKKKYDDATARAQTQDEINAAQREYDRGLSETAEKRRVEQEKRDAEKARQENITFGQKQEDRTYALDRLKASEEAEKEVARATVAFDQNRPGLMKQYEGLQQYASEAPALAKEALTKGPLGTVDLSYFGFKNQPVWADKAAIDGMYPAIAQTYSKDAADRFQFVLDGVRRETLDRVAKISESNPEAGARLSVAMEGEFVRIRDEMEKRVAQKTVDEYSRQPWAQTDFGRTIMEGVARQTASGLDPREIAKNVEKQRIDHATQLDRAAKMRGLAERITAARNLRLETVKSLSPFSPEGKAANRTAMAMEGLMARLEVAREEDLPEIAEEYARLTGDTGLPDMKEASEWLKMMSGLGTTTTTTDDLGRPVSTTTPVYSPQEVREAARGMQSRYIGLDNPNPASGEPVYGTRPGQESLGIPAQPVGQGQLSREVGAMSLNDQVAWDKSGRNLTWDNKPALPQADGNVHLADWQVVSDPSLNSGRYTLIPSVWGGKPVSVKESIRNAVKYQADNPGFQFKNPGAEGEKYQARQAYVDLEKERKAIMAVEDETLGRTKPSQPQAPASKPTQAAPAPAQAPAQPTAAPAPAPAPAAAPARPEQPAQPTTNAPRATGETRNEFAAGFLNNAPTVGTSVSGNKGKIQFKQGAQGFFDTLYSDTGPIRAQITELENSIAAADKPGADIEALAADRRRLARLKRAVENADALKSGPLGKELLQKAEGAQAMLEVVGQRIKDAKYYRDYDKVVGNLPSTPSTPEEVDQWRRFLAQLEQVAMSTEIGDQGTAQAIANTDKALAELQKVMRRGMGGE
jgi:hypothetical protein